jgi:hypothetical protein
VLFIPEHSYIFYGDIPLVVFHPSPQRKPVIRYPPAIEHLPVHIAISQNMTVSRGLGCPSLDLMLIVAVPIFDNRVMLV